MGWAQHPQQVMLLGVCLQPSSYFLPALTTSLVLPVLLKMSSVAPKHQESCEALLEVQAQASDSLNWNLHPQAVLLLLEVEEPWAGTCFSLTVSTYEEVYTCISGFALPPPVLCTGVSGTRC